MASGLVIAFLIFMPWGIWQAFKLTCPACGSNTVHRRCNAPVSTEQLGAFFSENLKISDDHPARKEFKSCRSCGHVFSRYEAAVFQDIEKSLGKNAALDQYKSSRQKQP